MVRVDFVDRANDSCKSAFCASNLAFDIAGDAFNESGELNGVSIRKIRTITIYTQPRQHRSLKKIHLL